MTSNQAAFLSMLAFSEGTAGKGDNGYNVIVGGELFHSYADHPRVKVYIRIIKDYSTCAGRYQIKASNYDAYKKMLKLTDFGPAAQDAIALQLIKECRAIPLIEAGKIEAAITACRSRWASLPGAGYGQPEHKMAPLVQAYKDAGGTVA